MESIYNFLKNNDGFICFNNCTAMLKGCQGMMLSYLINVEGWEDINRLPSDERFFWCSNKGFMNKYFLGWSEDKISDTIKALEDFGMIETKKINVNMRNRLYIRIKTENVIKLYNLRKLIDDVVKVLHSEDVKNGTSMYANCLYGSIRNAYVDYGDFNTWMYGISRRIYINISKLKNQNLISIYSEFSEWLSSFDLNSSSLTYYSHDITESNSDTPSLISPTNNITSSEGVAAADEVETKKSNIKEQYHKYGEYGNVKLTDAQLEKLKSEFPSNWEMWINKVDNYCQSQGKKYKDYLATIRNWASKDKSKEQKQYSYSNLNRDIAGHEKACGLSFEDYWAKINGSTIDWTEKDKGVLIF